jgi:hypothetical protein
MQYSTGPQPQRGSEAGDRQAADNSWRDVGVETTSEYLLLIFSVFFLSLSSRTCWRQKLGGTHI